MTSPTAGPAGSVNIMIGPGNIDGRWHFQPVELSFTTDTSGSVTVRSAECSAVGRGPDRVAAYRDWMRSTVRRYLELAQLPAESRAPELAREWKWLSKILRRS